MLLVRECTLPIQDLKSDINFLLYLIPVPAEAIASFALTSLAPITGTGMITSPDRSYKPSEQVVSLS